jgi:hypothetical protein
MTPSELRNRAEQELDELGPEPAAVMDQAIWLEERRGAVELLAGLGGWDAALLRRAALAVAGEWKPPQLSQLLLDAAAVSGTEARQ